MNDNLVRRILKKAILRNRKLKNTFVLLYIFSVLVPVIIVDWTLIYSINKFERQEQKNQLVISENEVISRFTSIVQQCIQMTNSISDDQELDEFLCYQYSSKSEYKEKYNAFSKYCSLNYYKFNSDIKKVTLYIDNATISDTDGICQLTDTVRKSWWYSKFEGLDKKLYILEDLSRSSESGINPHAGMISLVRRINLGNSKMEAVILIDFDYSQLNKYLLSETSGDDIYICSNNRILFANDIEVFDGNTVPVVESIKLDGTLVRRRIPFDGQKWTVVMKESRLPFWETILSSRQIIVFLMFVNLLLPTFVIRKIVKSILERLHVLDEHFGSLEREEFQLIEGKEKGDEIDQLFRHYNRTVVQIKKLIETIIRKNNEQHLAEVSRKQAELNALNTQVNPHFMYNTLECICMRSMIKGEKETAGVVRSLSVLLRQMSKWKNDALPIGEEVDLVEKYLFIQKYRFDEQIKYETKLSQNCKNILIPKLSLVSFVENACVHGIEESMDGGTITVAVSDAEDDVFIIVKDTGVGMESEKLNELMNRLKRADIDLLFQSNSTGILNAYIRLKMYFGDTFEFKMKSAKDVGTCIEICLRHVLTEKKEVS